MSSFLETFGRTVGNLRKGIYAPLMEHTAQVELDAKRKEIEETLARQQAAIELAGNLERQRNVVADYQQEPLPDGMHGVRPEWSETDDLKLYHAFGQAGIDPEKMAKAEREQLATEAFQRGLKSITNDAALVNIGMGKEYRPVELEGGVFYNPYDTQNFQLGTTDKLQAETRLKQTEADESEMRLARIRQLGNDVMQLNALNSKELGKPIEAVVEKDGKSVKTLISQDSSGRYHHNVVTDKATGEALVIPPEAADGGGLTTDQKNVAFYSKLWRKTPAETAEILKSKSLYSDAGFIESRLIANSKGSFGSRNSDSKILTATFDDFVRARYGSYFPEHFMDEIDRSESFSEAEKEAFKQRIEDYNQKVFEMELAGQAQPGATPAPAEPPVVSAPPAAPTMPPPVMPAITPSQAPLADMAMATSQQPAPPVPELAPAPLPELPPAPDFTAFAETVMTHNSPDQINTALKKQGFDLSPQAMGVMAIDAINQGVSPRDIQQLYQLLGIKWTPPA